MLVRRIYSLWSLNDWAAIEAINVSNDNRNLTPVSGATALIPRINFQNILASMLHYGKSVTHSLIVLEIDANRLRRLNV